MYIYINEPRLYMKQAHYYELQKPSTDCGTADLRLPVTANTMSSCVAGVQAKLECSDTFFFAPSKRWCKCQAKTGTCSKISSANYNEYKLKATTAAPTPAPTVATTAAPLKAGVPAPATNNVILGSVRFRWCVGYLQVRFLPPNPWWHCSVSILHPYPNYPAQLH
jgi:hypothetical protein